MAEVDLEALRSAAPNKKTEEKKPSSGGIDLNALREAAPKRSVGEKIVSGLKKSPRTMVDIGKGIIAAPTALLQGFSQTATAVVDKQFGTNLTAPTTKAFDYMLEPYRPETAAGNISQLAAEEGIKLIPLFRGLRIASKAAKGEKAGTAVPVAASNVGKALQKFGKSKTGQRIFASDAPLLSKETAKKALPSFGIGAAYHFGTEFLTSPDSRPSLSDQFDILPDFLQTEQYDNHKGRDNANRVLSNKLKRGFEIGAFSGLLDAGFFGAQAAVRSPFVSTPLSYGTRKTAEVIRKASDVLGEQVADTYAANLFAKGKTQIKPVTDKAGAKLARYFTTTGGADPVLIQGIRDTVDKGDGLQRKALDSMDQFHSATNNVLKRTKFWQKTKPEATELRNDLDAYLRFDFGKEIGKPFDLAMQGEKFQIKYGAKVREAADQMLDSRANLQDYMLGRLEREASVLGPGKRKDLALDAISVIKETNAAGEGYLRRIFEAKENPEQFLRNFQKKGGLKSKLYTEAVDEVYNNMGFMNEYRNVSPAIVRKKAEEVVNESIFLPAVIDDAVDPDVVLGKVIQGFKEARDKQGKLFAKDVNKFSVVEDMLIKRNELIDKSPKLRTLMGEVTDPLEAYVRTASDISKTTAAAELYSSILKSPLARDISQETVNDIFQGNARPSVVRVPTMPEIQARSKAAAQGVKYVDSPKENPVSGLFDSIGQKAGATDVPQTLEQIQRLESALDASNYVKLGADPDTGLVEESLSIFGGRYGDLTGQWVSPETYRALHEPLNLSPSSEIVGIFQQIRAFSQKMAIVPSPTTQVRNITGNFQMLMMNGNIQRNLDFMDAFEVFTKGLNDLGDDEVRRLADILNHSGLRDSSVIFRSLKEYQAAGSDLKLGGKLAKGIQGFEDVVPFMRFAEKIYGESDALFKALAYMGERNKLGNAFAKSGLNQSNKFLYEAMEQAGLVRPSTGQLGISKFGFLDGSAINIVKDTMPMYDRIPEALRFLDRVPIFGNFTSFASENFRNGYNILDRGLKELSFEISPAQRQSIVTDQMGNGLTREQALASIDIFEKQIRGIGAQRLTNSLAVAIAAPKGLTKFSQKLTGTTDAEMAAIEASVPDFAKGGNFIVLENDNKGNIEVVNQSYHNPYGYITEAIRSGVQAYNESGRLGKSEAKQLMDGAMAAGFEKFADPFGSETIIYDRLRTVLPDYLAVGRNGVTSTGSKVYRESDTRGEAFVKGTYHVLEGLAPRYWLEIAEERNGRPRPGKLLRSLTGTPAAVTGQETDFNAEFARLVTGFTPMKVSGVQSLGYNAEEYQQLRNDSRAAMGSVLRAPDYTAAEKLQAYKDYVEDQQRFQNLIYNSIKVAEELGTPADDIANALRGSGMGKSEIGSIMDGKLYITPVSTDFQRDLARYNDLRKITPMEEIPYTDINEYRKGFGDFVLDAAKLLPESRVNPNQRYQKIDLDALKSVAPQNIQAPVPTTPTIDLNQLRGIAPTSSGPVPQRKVDPTLLGTDPATQALAESLNRT